MYPHLWFGADSRPDALPDANLETDTRSTLASLDPMTLGLSPYLGSSMYKVDVLTTAPHSHKSLIILMINRIYFPGFFVVHHPDSEFAWLTCSL